MEKAKWLAMVLFTLLILDSGCKRGVESANDPLKEQAEEHYLKARRLFLACDPDKYGDAIKEYQLALNLWDEYPEALAGLAEALSMFRGYSLTEEEFGQAYQLAQRSLRLNPQLAAGYRAMADLFRHRREDDRALRQMESAIKYEPNNAENFYVKGSSLLSKDPKEAARVLIQAQKLNPDLAKIYFNLAGAAQKLGNYDEALKNLEKYKQMVPNDIGAYCSMGMIYLNKQETEMDEARRKDYENQAFELLKLTIAKSDVAKKFWQAPWVALAAKTLAKAYLEKQQYPEALTYLQKSEAVYPEDAELHYLFGLVYKKMGDKNKAREHLEKATQLAPDNSEIKSELKGL